MATTRTEATIHQSSYETVERIRNSVRHARPNPSENPAWANCHLDCQVLLAEIERLRAIVREIAHNPDCSSASCGIACRIYLGELPEQERPVGSATPSPK
jgi:hypothetical protein